LDADAPFAIRLSSGELALPPVLQLDPKTMPDRSTGGDARDDGTVDYVNNSDSFAADDDVDGVFVASPFATALDPSYHGDQITVHGLTDSSRV
jgi:hypothetical protein